MTTTRDFLVKRQAEIQKKLEPLIQQRSETEREIAVLERELSDVRSAADALGMVNRLPESNLGVTRREAPTPTIKEAALQILRDFPEGLIALDILAKINERYDLRLVRSSLSPQLTRLMRDGKLVAHDSVWRLARPPQP
jgi:hypothetical protein